MAYILILNKQLVFFYKLSVGVVRLISTNFLSPQQVASYFSRLASIKAKKGLLSQGDILAMEEEANFDNARQDILSSFQGKHPIVLDQYNSASWPAVGNWRRWNLACCSIFVNRLTWMYHQTNQERKPPM